MDSNNLNQQSTQNSYSSDTQINAQTPASQTQGFEELDLEAGGDISQRLKEFLGDTPPTQPEAENFAVQMGEDSMQMPSNPEGTIYLENTANVPEIPQESAPTMYVEQAPIPMQNNETVQEAVPQFEMHLPSETVPTAEIDSDIEKYIAPEFDRPAQAQDTQDQAPQQQSTAATAQPAEEQANVIDMRSSHEELHNVNQNADPTTLLADEKEKLFIEKVEHNHERKQ